MRTIRTKFAAMLAVLAFVAYQSEVDAQTTRSRTGTSSSASRTTSRSTASSDKQVSRPSGTASRPSGVAPRSNGPLAFKARHSGGFFHHAGPRTGEL